MNKTTFEICCSILHMCHWFFYVLSRILQLFILFSPLVCVTLFLKCMPLTCEGWGLLCLMRVQAWQVYCVCCYSSVNDRFILMGFHTAQGLQLVILSAGGTNRVAMNFEVLLKLVQKELVKHDLILASSWVFGGRQRRLAHTPVSIPASPGQFSLLTVPFLLSTMRTGMVLLTASCLL